MALVTILIQSMVKPLLSRFVAGLVFLAANRPRCHLDALPGAWSVASS